MTDPSRQHERPRRSNPFSAQRIRPGTLEYIFPPDVNAESLVRRLEGNGWWGEIVGPHGAGKSTLLATLIPALESAGRKTLSVELHDQQRSLPLDLDEQRRDEPFDLVIVDGYEQLSLWSRFRLKRICRRRGWGLLAAAHRSVGLPHLHQVAVTEELATRIVAELTAEQCHPPSDEQLSACFSRHNGNVREMLFDLYDLYERPQPR